MDINNGLEDAIKDILFECASDKELGAFYINYFTESANSSKDKFEKIFYKNLVDAIRKLASRTIERNEFRLMMREGA